LPTQIAQFAAELERYPQAVALYEGVARACVDNNLLKYR
jgi:alpha-soluble NSF attachment protein